MNRKNQPEGPAQDRESGVIMIAVVMTLLPLALVVSAFMTTMSHRTARLAEEARQERALLACEAGVDEAIYRAGTGTLAHGVTFSRTLSPGHSFEVRPVHLLIDGVDNDGDTYVDEPDEDVFRITVTGSYRRITRRVAAYLGPVANTLLPAIEGAITMQNPTATITLSGTCAIEGTNYDVDGTPGDPLQSTFGMSAAPPATTASVTGELTGSEPGRVTGVGPSPSVTSGSAVDLTALVDEVRNTASVVLPANVNGNVTIGNAAIGDYRIIYREGNVLLSGTVEMSGILVVTGDLRITGNLTFYGVIVCLGDILDAAGTSEIYGGVLLGPGSTSMGMSGTSRLRYSEQAIAGVRSLMSGTQYVAFNGWQELPRN